MGSGQLEKQKKNDPGSRHLLFMSSPQSCTTPEIVSNWLFVPEQREEHTVYATQVLYTDTLTGNCVSQITNERLCFDISVLKSVLSRGAKVPRTTLVGVRASFS